MITQTRVAPSAEAKKQEVVLLFHACDPEESWEQVEKHAKYLAVKAGVEWWLAFCLVLVSAPLVILLAMAVKLSSKGPAFYAQTRLGKRGRTYRIFKLRTMVHNAEAKSGPVWAAKNDCRVTKLGRLLRDTHLDELPQLWNVLRGEMALIGPRPERPEIASRIEEDLPGYRGRIAMRPGITGLAQMLVPADDPNEPASWSVRKKLAHDLYYVREVGMLLDLRIAVATPCYFLVAGVEAIRRSMVKPYGKKVEAEMELKLTEPTCMERA